MNVILYKRLWHITFRLYYKLYLMKIFAFAKFFEDLRYYL